MKTIQIGEKYYNAEALTETAKKLINDIQIVDNELAGLQIKVNINNLAKEVLIGELVKETQNLEEVPAPETSVETAE